MQFGFLLEQVVNGLVLGGYYLLIALGLSLIFSVGGIVNLAHGAFYALGAYISVEITKYLGFGPAVVLSPVAVGLLGILFESEAEFSADATDEHPTPGHEINASRTHRQIIGSVVPSDERRPWIWGFRSSPRSVHPSDERRPWMLGVRSSLW